MKNNKTLREKDKILDSERIKNQISRLRKRLSQGKVWIKFEYENEIKYEEDSHIKRIEYLLVTNICEYPSSFSRTFKITHNERIITDFKITKGKITYVYDPVWQNSNNYTRVIDRKFKIISKIPKKVIVSVTEYIIKERKRINEWVDSWFNFVQYEKHT